MVRYHQGVVQIPEISLSLEPWQVLEEEFVVFAAEVSLSYLLLKQVLLDLFYLGAAEDRVSVHFQGSIVCKIFFNLGTSDQSSIRIVHERATHLFPVLLFFRLFLLLFFGLLLALLMASTMLLAADESLQAPLDIVLIVQGRVGFEYVARFVVLKVLYFVLVIVGVYDLSDSFRIVFFISIRRHRQHIRQVLLGRRREFIQRPIVRLLLLPRVVHVLHTDMITDLTAEFEWAPLIEHAARGAPPFDSICNFEPIRVDLGCRPLRAIVELHAVLDGEARARGLPRKSDFADLRTCIVHWIEI